MAFETTTGTPINVNPVNVGTKQDKKKRPTEKQHTQPTEQRRGSEHTHWSGHLQAFRTLFFSHTFTFQLLDKPWSQVSSLLPPGSCLQILIAHRVQQSHCSSIFYRVLLTHALALSASQFVHKKKSQRIYTSMHSAGLELTKLTYTRLEDDLIRHRGDPLTSCWCLEHETSSTEVPCMFYGDRCCSCGEHLSNQ